MVLVVTLGPGLVGYNCTGEAPCVTATRTARRPTDSTHGPAGPFACSRHYNTTQTLCVVPPPLRSAPGATAYVNDLSLLGPLLPFPQRSVSRGVNGRGPTSAVPSARRVCLHAAVSAALAVSSLAGHLIAARTSLEAERRVHRPQHSAQRGWHPRHPRQHRDRVERSARRGQ